MVPTPLVGVPIDEGRALVEKLIEQGVPVNGAYWLYTEEIGRVRLYIVSPLVDEVGPTEVYSRVRKTLSTLDGTPLSLDDIAVVSPRDRFVQAVRASIKRGSRTRDIRITGAAFNNVLADDMYVYWLD